MTLRWKAYYGDGSTFSNADGHAYEAPARDVQVIAVADPEHGWRLERGGDYYWWLATDDTWLCGDIFGLFDYLIEPGPKRVLFGRAMPYPEFRAVLDRALADTTLPPKTGWQPNERR